MMFQSKLKRICNNLDWFHNCLAQYRKFTINLDTDEQLFHKFYNHVYYHFRDGNYDM